MIGMNNIHDTFRVTNKAVMNPWINLEIHQDIEYTGFLEIGPNRDQVEVSIDSSEADLWVISKDAECVHPESEEVISEDAGESCHIIGTFDVAESESFKIEHDIPDLISFTHNFQASGVWGTDEIVVGDVVIENIPFGVANQTTNHIGILGLGKPSNSRHAKTNLLAELANRGIIHRRAYSIYLGPLEGKGSVLFGGIDRQKIKRGTLKKIPMVTNSSHIAVNVDRIEISSKKAVNMVSQESTKYNLETARSYSIFPENVIDGIAAALGGEFNHNLQAYSSNCSLADTSTMRLQFGNTTFDIPTKALISARNQNSCYLSVDSGEQFSFGVDILRYLYTVVDFDEMKVSFAAVKFTDEENIEAMPVFNSTIIQQNDEPIYHASKSSMAMSINSSLYSLWKWILIGSTICWTGGQYL
ncbi:Candidapepsin-10 [Spathaspora sp. JA1]|nr:Candidapepsin-10 [Spathaspora sp. JA1]